MKTWGIIRVVDIGVIRRLKGAGTFEVRVDGGLRVLWLSRGYRVDFDGEATRRRGSGLPAARRTGARTCLSSATLYIASRQIHIVARP